MNRYIGGKIVQPTDKRTSSFNITPEVVAYQSRTGTAIGYFLLCIIVSIF